MQVPTSSVVSMVVNTSDHYRHLADNQHTQNTSALKVLLFNVGTFDADELMPEGFQTYEKLVWLKLPTSKALEADTLTKLRSLNQLRVLECNNTGVSDSFTLHDLTTVQYLDISANLRLMTLSSKFNALTSLEYLSLSGCLHLMEQPDISSLKSLFRLDLKGCWNLASLVGLSSSSLQYLNISGCRKLIEAPHFDKVVHLKQLYMSECGKVRKLSKLETLTSLEVLDLSHNSIEALSGLSALQQLVTLSLRNSTSLTTLDITELGKLQVLDLSYCEQLTSLYGLHSLQSLERLQLKECIQLGQPALPGRPPLPLDLTGLVELQELVLADCRALVSVHGINSLHTLRHLDLSRCHQLKGVLNVTDVITVNDKQRGVLDVTGLASLQYFDISGCLVLDTINGTDTLESLGVLKLLNITTDQLPPEKLVFNEQQSSKLRELSVSTYEHLSATQQQRELPALTTLTMRGCIAISQYAASLDISAMPLLEQLYIHSCDDLTAIIGLDDTKTLQELTLISCRGFKRLRHISSTTTLTKLSVESCSNLKTIDDKLTDLVELKELNVKQSGIGKIIHDESNVDGAALSLRLQIEELKERPGFMYTDFNGIFIKHFEVCIDVCMHSYTLPAYAHVALTYTCFVRLHLMPI
jgi:Leucine-rich repeat (LRR) protein